MTEEPKPTQENVFVGNIAPPPKEIGYWEHRTGFKGSFGVSFLRLNMYRKPSWITRYLMKHLMEIHWIEHEKTFQFQD